MADLSTEPVSPRRIGDEAETSALDGTLRAIVAADRLGMSEAVGDKALLHRRLTVFYGYFALVSVMAAATARITDVLADVEPSTATLVLNVQLGHTLVLGAIFFALRFGMRDPRLVRTLDVIATVATAVTAAVTLSVMTRALSVDVTAVSFFILFFALRAALVPSKPWVATLVAAVSAIPFAIGLANMYERAAVADPFDATFSAVRSMAAGIAGVFVVSKTIYGLRRVVEQAVQLGQYVVHEKIGEGGMGVVYRASHAMLKRPTAVKLIAPGRAGEKATARFEREVMAASRLSHPNNVAIYDYGRTRGGVFYYAMELLEGHDLGALVEREGPQSVARTTHILRQLTAALGEAHDAGLVHRDVKPANVMLCTRGGVTDFVKVLDFGLVKHVTASDATAITVETTLAGTPLYMAPESVVSPERVGPAADVYAVGCVAYFLLTGRPPFGGRTVLEVCAAHLHDTPAPPSRHVTSIPEELDALILRCLAKDPDARPTMRALGLELTS